MSPKLAEVDLWTLDPYRHEVMDRLLSLMPKVPELEPADVPFDPHLDQKRAYRLRAYGLGVEAFWRMFRDQGERCAICENPLTEETCEVDHCHRTGKVRGILCARCNNGLGQFKDNPKVLGRAIEYLRRGAE